MSLPAALGGPALTGWRLTQSIYAATWDDGEGAFRYGGRWNSKGLPVVDCSLDASTAILEVAVHTGFRALDTVPHSVTAFEIVNPSDVLVVNESDVPIPTGLRRQSPAPDSRLLATRCSRPTGLSSFAAPFRNTAGICFSSPHKLPEATLSNHRSDLPWIRAFIRHRPDRRAETAWPRAWRCRGQPTSRMPF